MFSGILVNTAVADRPLLRLTIGVTNCNGERDEMQFVRDEESSNLVAQVPTEREMNEMYLLMHDWTKTTLDGINAAWEDPLNGGAYLFENALQIQEGRDMQDGIADTDTVTACCECKVRGVYIIPCDCECHAPVCEHGNIIWQCTKCSQDYAAWVETQGGQDPRPLISFQEMFQDN